MIKYKELSIGTNCSLTAIYKILNRCFAVSFYFLFCQISHAQNLCNNIVNAGDFSISSDKICLLNGKASVSVIDASGGTNINYIFDYKGEAPALLEKLPSHSEAQTYTYTKIGTYTILQYGTKGGPIYACKTIKIVEMKDFAVSVKSCDNSNEISVTIENNTVGYDAYEIVWENGNILKDAKIGTTYKHTYTGAKPNQITVNAKFNDSGGNGCTNPKNINLGSASAKPLITKLEMPADNQAIIGFQGGATDVYELYYRIENTNTWTLSANNQPTKLAGVDYEVKANNLDITKNYCFKIQNNNGCINPVESDEVCTIKLDATYKGDKTDVSWTPYKGVNTYNLERIDNAGSKNTTVSKTNYTDTEISCNQDVCYRAWIAIGNTSIYSNKKCIKNGATTKAPALQTISLDIRANGNILINVQELDGNIKQKYVFLRADSPNGVFKVIGTTGVPNFTDETVNTNKQSYCYKVQYEDLCKNLSNPSAPICSIYCTVDANGKVTWTPFENPLGVLSYKVHYIDENGVDNEKVIQDINKREFVLDSTILAKNQNKTSIYIEALTNPPAAFPNFGPFKSFSNTVTFIIAAKFYLPTAFTPNGKNPIFSVIADQNLFKTFQMLIYNSWGELLFESNDILTGWNGTYQGQNAPTGTYAYKVLATDINGKSIQKIGTVLLIR